MWSPPLESGDDDVHEPARPPHNPPRNSHVHAGKGAQQLDPDDPNFERTPYDLWLAYGRSETANVLFAVEFEAHHYDRGVRATALRLGGIRTEIDHHVGEGSLLPIVASIAADLAAEGKLPFEFKSVPQGAATSVWAAIVASADEVSDRYCENCLLTTRLTMRKINPVSEGSRPYVIGRAHAAALPARSERMAGERF